MSLLRGSDNNKKVSRISYTEKCGLRLFRPFSAYRVRGVDVPRHSPSLIHLVTYADDRHGVRGGVYKARQRRIQSDVSRYGLAKCRAYSPADLQTTPEYTANPSLFSLHPFANGHAFKPVILRKALETIENDEYLLYYDCTRFLLGRSVSMLQKLCDYTGGALTWQYGDPNAKWVKRSVFAACGDRTFQSAEKPHLGSGWFMFKVTDSFRTFINKWTQINCIPEIASERQFSQSLSSADARQEDVRYIENRGDQSIFSVLSSVYGYEGFLGASYGFNQSPKLFVLSMWTGSSFFRRLCKVRASIIRP